MKGQNSCGAQKYLFAYLNKNNSSAPLLLENKPPVLDENVGQTTAVSITNPSNPFSREHRFTIAEINSATLDSMGNASFTVLGRIQSVSDKWLLIYCPTCFRHMSEWEGICQCKTCMCTVHPTERLNLAMEVIDGTGPF